MVRLAIWARLERTSTGDLYDRPAELDAKRAGSVEEAQARGIIDPSIAPHEVLALVTAMSMTWSPASAIYAAGEDEPKPGTTCGARPSPSRSGAPSLLLVR
ncbi:hypothetical protein ACTU45_05000 [Streptomyces sp. 24-1644]|uniref:hypothetical protein n=1 Tax=Streptomyces sp. 24-1644 TaxID=3457315 RepID=UPI003FA6E02D